MKLKYYIFILIFVGILIFISNLPYFNDAKKYITEFDTTNINGTIEYAEYGHHGEMFKIKENNKVFLFYASSGKLSENKEFVHLAEKGDTVYKPKFADTLVLIKNKRKYLFTFKK
jgi:hypothetical protein